MSGGPQIMLDDEQNCDFDANLLNMPTITKRPSKWRLAFAVLFSSRVLVSLAKEIIAKRKNKLFPKKLRNPSYTSLDIDLLTKSDAVCSSVDDKVGLYNLFLKNLISDIFKGKNLHILVHPSRVHEPAPLYFEEEEKEEVALLKVVLSPSKKHGASSITKAYGTDSETGIDGDADSISYRRSFFGSNTYEELPPKGLFHFVLKEVTDITTLVLLNCATLGLVFGFKADGWKEGQYYGGCVFVVVFLVVIVSAVSNYCQSLQTYKMWRVSNNIQVKVVRDGRQQHLSSFEIVIGDIVYLKKGDQIPADGLFLDGDPLLVAQSMMTGESMYVEFDESTKENLLSGSMVVDGHARMVVISVGMATSWGQVMSVITPDEMRTPLQERVEKLTSYIMKNGLVVAFLCLIVFMVQYFTGNMEDEVGNKKFNGSKTKFNDVMNSAVEILAATITIVVVALPKSMLSAVTLTLTYAIKRMMADKVMVKKLSACETMGSATTICIDTTLTIALNQINVTEFWIGEEAIKGYVASRIAQSSTVIELLHQAVGLNTTASVYRPTSRAVPEFSGSPTAKAILSWAVLDLGLNLEELKRNCSILHAKDFNTEGKSNGVLIRKMQEKITHVHWKGAAEKILARCANYYDYSGIIKAINEEERGKLQHIIQDMVGKNLQCIAFAHKVIPEEEYNEEENPHQSLQEDNLTLLGLMGVKHPCQQGVKELVKACKDAEVNIKMITGENIFTARAIAMEWGILETNQELSTGMVVEGLEFLNYTEEERMQTVESICVMASSSATDRLLMVQYLKKKNHVVAVIGNDIDDVPALREADIGLCLGIQGKEMVKKSSDIVILDDNFTSVLTILRWGRCVYNNIQKLIQFQLTVNVAALVINLITTVSAGEVPLTAIQLLWVNLIMDTLGALALATEWPTQELMKKTPIGQIQIAPLITNVMWRNLTAQVIYQIIVLLTLWFKGESIFNVNDKVKNTMIFNTFVLCQIFNEFNARKLEKRNIFKGIQRERLFLGIVGFTLFVQVVLVEFGKKFASTEKLSWLEWIACMGIAAVSWPIGCIVKYIPVPDEPILNLLKDKACQVLM